MVHIRNLTRNQSGLSQSIVDFMQQSVHNVGDIKSKISTSKYKNLYLPLLNKVNSDILRKVDVRKAEGWSQANGQVYLDPLGQPYHKTEMLQL